ncbi:unannotated protein [freshwater metagenome]|jgi:uncharacterized protein (DUF885 family)|uniref:Unannotated protein n=1 Tax=freshwater metagenome TaxID=449393 RepID=A0A6J6CFC8_9ZZZZ|nr:DUF885 family protein [Actinomycetota bacterium]
MREKSPIDNLADSYLAQLAANYPSFATSIGLASGAAEMDDYSPAAIERDRKLNQSTLAALKALEPKDDVDQVTKDALSQQLALDLELDASGLQYRSLNNIASPAQGIRDVFDLSPTATIADWENIASRMRKVKDSLTGYQQTLAIGFDKGDGPAKRQLNEVITQVEQINQPEGFFHEFAKSATADQELSTSLREELVAAAKVATDAYAAFGDFLKGMLPKASEQDAIGRERYRLLSKSFLGAEIDLDETYQWGIEELARVVAEQEAVANEILPGASVAEAIAHLENDPTTKLHGTEELQKWMQRLSDKAIEDLGKTHFDIAEPLRKLECMIAPTKHGGIYYTGPSDDFSRPGRMWWSVPEGVESFDTWRETTTVYHEGVPGHHLQVAQATYIRETLNDWRRLASWTSGHGEGWALYAERLMDELGYLATPADRLGMLDGQRMRAARVVLDIGVHLGKPKLDGSGVWDFDYALDFMSKNVNMSPEFVRFEVTRYFGWPGQAPSYKIGQRIWEQIRDDYRARKGSEFNMKKFHSTALNLGGLGLDALKEAMSRA